MHEMKDGKMTLSTGVVFRITDVPPYAFDAVKKKMASERPQVPVIYIEAKDREEPNPNDPDYIEAMETYESKLNEKLVDMVITLGAEAESVPGGFPRDSDNGWSDKLKMAGIDVPKDGHDRYLAWMKLCAMRTSEDLTSMVVACARSAGVTEEDVAAASASFRDSKKRGTDTGS